MTTLRTVFLLALTLSLSSASSQLFNKGLSFAEELDAVDPSELPSPAKATVSPNRGVVFLNIRSGCDAVRVSAANGQNVYYSPQIGNEPLNLGHLAAGTYTVEGLADGYPIFQRQVVLH